MSLAVTHLVGFGSAGSSGIGGIDANTVLMLHCDGSNGSTTFTDSSPTPKTVTPNGDAKVSTADSKFGGASLLLDGSGDYLAITDHADFTWAGQFTIDFWIKTSTSTQDTVFRRVICLGTDAAASIQLLFYNGSGATTNIGFHTNSMIITGSIAVADGNWNHVALSRDGSNNCRLFVNGVQSGSTASNSTTFDAGTINIGRYSGGNGHVNGYIDEIRFSNIARWTSGFTPPAEPYSI